MHKLRWAVALTLGLGTGLAAQEADAPATPAPSPAALEKIAQLEQEIAEFTKKWREEQKAESEKQAEEARKAAAEGRPAPKVIRAMAMRPDYASFVEKLGGWSAEASGEDQALFLVKMVQLGGVAKGSKGLAALEQLAAEHLQSSQWASLGMLLPNLSRALGEERAKELWAKLADHPNGDVRGYVALAIHGSVLKSAELESVEYKASRAAVLAAAEKVSDARLRSQLEGAVDLREKLADGAVAPDIEGVDIDGVAFKLSDYKGKIVFLDFWGDW
ncbi:MAG: hypothetical protein IPN34_09540 [Planctomycetes bacterium]|nr:hypothetical protein [Planctomycetota bacterium]